MKNEKVILAILALLILIFAIQPVQATQENTENSSIIIYDSPANEDFQPPHTLYKQIYRQNHIESCFDMIIGFVSGITFYVGIKSVLNRNKKLGIIELILAFLAPIFTFILCKCYSDFRFWGNSMEFLLKTIFCNNPYQMFFANLTLITYIFLIVLTIYNILQIRKIKGEK